MKTAPIFKSIGILFFLLLVLYADNAYAAISNQDIMETVLDRYRLAANTWSAVIAARATWLFWVLAMISMVWTFGMIALRKADIGEFFAEFLRFTIFTGFFWWLLINGPNFAIDIINSMRTIAGNASGVGPGLTPSGIVDIGFHIFFTMLDQSTVWSPVDSTVGIIISLAILIVMALISVNMLVLLISGWILAYAGIFFLGFGGSKWTSEMAIGYFKTVLGIAVQLYTMVLLVGIGQSFVDQYYQAMSAGLSLKELGVMLIVALVLLMLVNKVPPLLGGLAGAHTAHSLGSGMGAGAVMAAGAAIATAGAAAAAGAANIAGGSQAIMAAFSSANASESGGGSGGGDLLAAMGGGGSGDTGGGSSLASAMGDSGGSSSGGSTSSASSSSGMGDSDGSSSGGVIAATQKAGRIMAGATKNLAKGTWNVAAQKVRTNTIGGQIASMIEASNNNDTTVDPESEVAAFRDKSS